MVLNCACLHFIFQRAYMLPGLTRFLALVLMSALVVLTVLCSCTCIIWQLSLELSWPKRDGDGGGNGALKASST